MGKVARFASGRRTKWVVVGIWLVLGIALYFSYGFKHSRLRATRTAVR